MTVTTAAATSFGIIMVIGLVAVVCALGYWWRDHRRAATWRVADGAVVGHADVSDVDGAAFHTVIEFTDSRGEAVRFRSFWTAATPEHRVGDILRVYYPSEHPQDAHIIGENAWVVRAAGAAGLVTAVLSAAIVVWLLRDAPR